MDKPTPIDMEDQLTFADIIKMFRGKLKIIICVALIAAIIGGAAGVFSTCFFIPAGADIKFYLNPGANTQTLLQHLKSDSFAERLLLNEYGLPDDPTGLTGYKEAEDAVKEMLSARETVIELDKKLTNFNYAISTEPDAKDYEKITFNEIDKRHSELVAQYEKYYALLEVYKSAFSDKVADQPSHIEKTQEYEDAVAKALDELEDYRNNYYYPKTIQKTALIDEFNRARADLKEKRDTADEKVEIVLAQWRNDPEVQRIVSIIRESVTYKYATIVEDDIIKDSANVNEVEQNTNFSFLEISVNVSNDKEAAQLIVEKIKERTPDFIILNLEKLTGVAEAKCTLISTFAEAKKIGQESVIKNILIFAAIAAAVVVVIACAVIIIKGILPPDTFTKKTKKKEKVSKAE